MNETEIDINVKSDDWPDISDLVEEIKEVLHENLVFNRFTGRTVEISLVLADNDFVQNLNKTYRDKDKPTNVLSFPQDPGPGDQLVNLGDVVLAYETVQKECAEQNKDFKGHVTHLIVHGILHLLEYDHENDAEADEMEGLEIRILERLGIKNPYEPIAD